jgi:membrane associated rhomboid family serine protease
MAQANLRLAVTIILINVVFGVAIANVDNWAHGGGLVAGFLSGLIVEGFGPRRLRPLVRVLGLVALVVVGIAFTAWRTAQLRPG